MKLKFLLLLFIVNSCNSPKSSIYIIDPKTFVENRIILSEIADDINYIPLDNTLPIGIVYCFKEIDNFIYISVKDVGLLVFSSEGKLIKKIGNIGRGPSEYLFCTSFTVDIVTKNIYILDSGNRIKAFSESGRYLKSFLLPESSDGSGFEKLEFYNSNLLAAQFINMGHAEYNWIVLDTLGNLISAIKNTIPAFPGNIGSGGDVYKYNNNLYYWNWYNDTVFSVLPDFSARAVLLFSQGEYRLPKSQISFSQISQYMQPNSLFETKHFLIFNFFYKKPQFVIIDKEDKKSFLTILKNGEMTPSGFIKLGGIFNDMDGGVPFQPQYYFYKGDEEKLIEIIYPYQLKELIATNEFLNSASKDIQSKSRLLNLSSELSETDNPILMVVNLKK